MEMISNITLLIFIAFSTACLEAFYQACMRRGMILEFWFRFLKKMEAKGLKNTTKLLGLCSYCNQVYIAIAYFCFIFGEINLFLFLLLGIQYLFQYVFLHYIVRHD